MFLDKKTYELLPYVNKDELEELRKEAGKLGGSLAEKEVRINQLTEKNDTLSYDLVQAKLHVSHIEESLGSWKDSIDAEQIKVVRL